jgi:hypothetical protein
MITAAISLSKTREAMRMYRGSPLKPKRFDNLMGSHTS